MLNMDVSIVIVSYNTEKLTLQCIDSIIKYTHGLEYEIIVVDNGSADNTINEIKEKYKKVHIIENTKNLGFGSANNIGADYAKGKFLFFLNSDTVLLNNALKKFVDFYLEYQDLKIGALGGWLLDKNMNVMHSGSKFPKIRDQAIGYLHKILDKIKDKKSERDYSVLLYYDTLNYHKIDYVTGADLFILKETFEKIGGFDTDFFLYYEETYMQYRLKKDNYSNFLVKGPKIIHYCGKSQRKNFQKRLMFDKSNILFQRKTKPPFKVIIYKIIYVIFSEFAMIFAKEDKKNMFDYIKYISKW